jgi:hypothetical protein
VGVGPFPVAFAFSPGARTLYVASFAGNYEYGDPDQHRDQPPRPGAAGRYAPDALAATSSGVYAVDGNSDEHESRLLAHPGGRFPGRGHGDRLNASPSAWSPAAAPETPASVREKKDFPR